MSDQEDDKHDDDSSSEKLNKEAEIAADDESEAKEKKKPASQAKPTPKKNSTSTSSSKKKKNKNLPSRPLSAYNIYFKQERPRILQELADDKPQEDYLSNAKAAMERVISKKQKKNGASKKRSSSSKTDAADVATTLSPSAAQFQAIASTIASRWKKLAAEERVPFEKLAQEEMKRYMERKEECHKSLLRECAMIATAANSQKGKGGRGSNDPHEAHIEADFGEQSAAAAAPGVASMTADEYLNLQLARLGAGDPTTGMNNRSLFDGGGTLTNSLAPGSLAQQLMSSSAGGSLASLKLQQQQREQEQLQLYLLQQQQQQQQQQQLYNHNGDSDTITRLLLMREAQQQQQEYESLFQKQREMAYLAQMQDQINLQRRQVLMQQQHQQQSELMLLRQQHQSHGDAGSMGASSSPLDRSMNSPSLTQHEQWLHLQRQQQAMGGMSMADILALSNQTNSGSHNNAAAASPGGNPGFG